MRIRAIVAVLCWCALGGGDRIRGSELLKVQISPLVAPAPGFVRVQTFVDTSDDTRSLEVRADSPDFTRVSTIELEGRTAPRAAVFDFPGLPAGRYEISAVLAGTRGVLATATQTVQIVQMAGPRN